MLNYRELYFLVITSEMKLFEQLVQLDVILFKLVNLARIFFHIPIILFLVVLFRKTTCSSLEIFGLGRPLLFSINLTLT